jgi:tetratricopeptide (TPR) repeat protein
MTHDRGAYLEQARHLVKEKRVTEAIALLQHHLEQAGGEEERVEAWLELGIIYNGMADFSHALNYFNAVLRIRDHSQACAYVEMINGILNYYNKELLNP